MSFKKSQFQSKNWQLKGFLISILLFSFLCSIHSKTLYSSIPPQKKLTEDRNHILDRQYQEKALKSTAFMSFSEENAETSAPFELNPPVSIKLSMGRTLSRQSMQVYSAILTKDGQTAFASIIESGEIKISDVSNPNKITIISSVKLKMDRPFLINALALSPDEKTLFMSTMLYLQIIDVSNVRAPRVLAELKDPKLDLLQQYFSDEKYPFDYRVSIALSKDQKTLFVAGLGLQVIDISNKEKPVFISSNTDQVDDEDLNLTEVQISQNGERLFITNGTVNIYDIRNATNLKFLGSYSSSTYFISSAFPSKQDENIVHLVGWGKYDIYSSTSFQTLYEKIDIKDPSNPVQLESDILNYKSGGALYILGLSFNETVAYVFYYPRKSESLMGVLNMNVKKNKLKVDFNMLTTTSIASFPDERKILVAENLNALEIRELYKNYPNKRIYSSADISIGRLPFQGGLFQADSMILSPEQSIMIIKGKNRNFTTTEINIVNISNLEFPEYLSSWNCANTIKHTSEMKFLEDPKQIVLISEWTDSISLLNLSEDFKDIVLTGNFSKKGLGKVASFQLSSDGKIGYFVFMTTEKGDSYSLKTISFPDFKILNETKVNIYKHKSFITTDNRFLFLIGSRILVYDVTDASKPQEISSTLIDFHDQQTYPLLALLSPDEKTVYTRTFDGSSYSFRIYDLQNLSKVKLLSELPLPMEGVTTRGGMNTIFSRDYKTAYMGYYGGSILAVNISNPALPFVQGTFFVPGVVDLDILRMWKDGETIFYIKGNTLQVANLVPPYTLYMDTESIRLGAKYRKPAALLKYDRRSQEYGNDNSFDYKIIKTSLSEVQANQNQANQNQAFVKWSYSALPLWMSFDKESRMVTLEPKNQENLGTYTFHSAFSMHFPKHGFQWVNRAQNKSDDDDSLLLMMISLGFLDQKSFLTSNFGTFQDFSEALPQNLPNKTMIYNILRGYYFETFTVFDVFPSLDVSYDEKIVVNTLSENQVRVEIELTEAGAGAGENKFINKQYGSIKPTILEGGSQILLEGSQKEINNALGLLVVSLENGTEPCEGTIRINDRLNPVVTKEIKNISKLFNINEQPKMAIPIQAQIDSQNIETGTYFTINFKKGTFIDTWNNDLSFDLVSGDPRKSLPSWISFSNMSLRGTPPEEIVLRDLKFNLTVRNEFKSVEIPFRINVRISPTFALKLLARYSPYILTVVGLIVYANKIYNIGCKKRYRYPRDFYLKVGKEITSSVIPPMIFIWKENQESMIILKYLKESVAKELGVKKIKESEVAEYFANSEGTRIDRSKLENKIKETLEAVPKKILKKKLDFYVDGAEGSKELITQIIFNQLTSWLLENNLETKKFFEIIKDEWMELVDWDSFGMCKIRESRLLELLFEADLENNEPKEQNGDYSRMTDNSSLKEIVKVDLLKDAVEVYALKKQSINYHSPLAHVMIKYKLETNFIKRFVKKDLQDVNFSDRGKMIYGIHFKVENDVLSFHGVPERKFFKKTVVVQITNKKHRILNEIWIHGVSNHLKESEGIGKERSYEVY